MAKSSHPHERLKAVIRRLPPNLPEPIFWQSVEPWITADSVSWKVYCPGKLQKGFNKESVLSRAYIAFRAEEQLAHFSREYDGHLFRDKNGSEYQAVVEFAPYQKIPGDKKKVDNRIGTIENDEDYVAFLQLTAQATDSEPLSIEALVASIQPPPVPTTTPLLEALKAEKTAMKDKESILRNHAHYKEQVVRSKKEEKKKPESKKKSVPPSAPAESSSHQKTPTKQPKPSKLAKQSQPPKNQPPSVPAVESPAASTSETPSDATASRRTRPVIGLGRQFEAALNGAGVSAGKTKPKKDDKDPSEVSTSSSIPPVPIPKRPRKPKERAFPPTVPPPPNILQRGDGPPPAILQREAPAPSSNAADDPPPPRASPDTPRGGGGRKRGRGRGGPPPAANSRLG